MPVICNATPLINFATINRLEILKAIFTQVIIPRAVYEETTQYSFSSSQLILTAIKEEWLQVEEVNIISDNIPNILDAGEREVIALAIFLNKKRVLLDEKEARKVAQVFGFKVIGTLGILILAKDSKIIDEVKPLLDEMINSAQYWVNKSLYQQVLQTVQEL